MSRFKPIIISTAAALIMAGALTVQAGAPVLDEASLKKTIPAPGDRDRALIESVSKRQKELDSREEELKAREERVSAVREDVNARIVELKKVQGSIETLVKKIDEINGERVKRLV